MPAPAPVPAPVSAPTAAPAPELVAPPTPVARSGLSRVQRRTRKGEIIIELDFLQEELIGLMEESDCSDEAEESEEEAEESEEEAELDSSEEPDDDETFNIVVDLVDEVVDEVVDGEGVGAAAPPTPEPTPRFREMVWPYRRNTGMPGEIPDDVEDEGEDIRVLAHDKDDDDEEDESFETILQIVSEPAWKRVRFGM